MRYRASIYIDIFADNEEEAKKKAEDAAYFVRDIIFEGEHKRGIAWSYVGEVDEYESLKK